VLVVILVLKTDFAASILDPSGASSSENHYYVEQSIAHHRRMDASVPEGAVLFIGDSLIQGLATSAIDGMSVNYGIGNDTTTGVIHRLPLYSSIDHARLAIIAIGINDLRIHSDATIKTNLDTIAKLIPDKTQFVFSGLLPIDESLVGIDNANERILTINRYLEALMEEYPNGSFIDIAPLLSAPGGELDRRYHDGDGLHLNKSGYAIMIQAFSELLTE